MSQENQKMQKQTIGLQFYQTIPRRVTIIHDNQIENHSYSAVYKYFNGVSPSYDWFPYKYIDAEFNKKLDKTKGRLAGDETEKDTKHYVEPLNRDTNWLKTIIIEIDKFLIDC